MLKANELVAIAELKLKSAEKFSLETMILFGSKARGDDDIWSDVDLLILLNQPVDWDLEKKIIHIAHDIEIDKDVIFGLLVFEKNYWNDSANQLQLRKTIETEGKAA